MTAPEAYRLLGVSPGAGPKEVQSAYRKKALEWHPDRARSPEEAGYFQRRFLEVRDAYEVLRREGFPVPEPEKVVEITPESFTRWAAGRSFAPKGPPEEVPLTEKLGLKFEVNLESLIIWGVLMPGGAIGLYYFLRFFLRSLAP